MHLARAIAAAKDLPDTFEGCLTYIIGLYAGDVYSGQVMWSRKSPVEGSPAGDTRDIEGFKVS